MSDSMSVFCSMVDVKRGAGVFLSQYGGSVDVLLLVLQ